MRNLFLIIGVAFFVFSCGSPERKQLSSYATVSDSSKYASCVYLTTDENNRPVISWVEKDEVNGRNEFYMSYFDEKSNNFSQRINIPIEQNASLHEEGMPKLAVKGNGMIVAVYETSAPTDKNKFAGAVKYVISADRGKSWTVPRYLHADTAIDASHSFAAITRLADGEIGASWLDANLNYSKPGRPVKFAKTNALNVFSDEMIIDSVACECCRLAISSSENKIAVVFRDIINDSVRDISVTTSIDNGKTFAPATPFSNDGWVINGCPHNGPSVVNAGQRIYATWFTGGSQPGVYYGELNDKMDKVERRLISDHGRFIQLCLLQDGSRLLVYDEKRKEGDVSYNKIVLKEITGKNTFTSEINAPKTLATYPVVKAFGLNKVVVAWSQGGQINYTTRLLK